MAGSAVAGTLGLVAGYLLKTTVVLTLALLAAAAAKRRSAAFRHFVLSSALIGLVFLPFLSLVPVGLKSPLLPAWMAASAPRAEDRAAAARSSDVLEGASLINRVVGEVQASSASQDPAEPAASDAGMPVSSGSTANLLLALVWPAGFVILILRLAGGLAGAARLTAEGTPLSDPAWRVLLERFLAFVSLRRRVRLKSHPEVFMPLTWGWRKPVVLLPAGADTWTAEERSSALFHELSHVKRSDFLVMMLVRTSLALFWWNPLCWAVYRRLLKEQEIACDELVLRAGIRPSTYAASLLAFRRSAGFRWNPSAALLGMLGRSSFQERLAAILRQKMILMEVKMKTKLMLAVAIVVAVALIGTARPAAGREASERAAVVAETAVPAPSSFDVAPPEPTAQEKEAEKAVVQEKEKEKEKCAIERKIVVTAKEGSKMPIEVIITEGEQVKKLVLDKPLTITKSKDGDVLVLTLEGKDIEVLKGKPLRLEIKGGAIEVVKEGKALKIGEGGILKLVKEDGKKGRTFVIYGAEECKPGEPGKLQLITEDEVEKGGVKVVKIVKEGEPGIAWIIKEPGKEPGKAFAILPAREKELLEKVRAIREQVEAVKAKKLEIDALAESLKKLEAELQAKEEKLKELEIKLEKAPGEIALKKKFSADKSKDKGDGTINLILTGKKGDEGKLAFERAVAKLKSELPQGYTLVEQTCDPEDGTMRFEISAAEGKKTDETLIRKLVDLLQAEIKK